MAKSSNPVDAHRKAQRKAELKKNKQTRSKQKEVTTIKRDTRPIEQEIRQLAQKGSALSKSEKDELASLRAELSRVNKAKQEYVETHPEHRQYVFPDRPSQGEQDAGPSGAGGGEPPGLYDRNGRLKHPERSLYYDATFNPFGVPPPGMPYREKPEYEMARLGIPTPEQMAAFQPQVMAEAEDSESEDGDSDDDIMMPAGPPPGTGPDALAESNSDSDDDDDDIALPPGPPPPKPDAKPPSSTTSRISIQRPSNNHPRPRPPPHHPSNGHAYQPPYIPYTLPTRPNVPLPPSLPPPAHAPSGPRNPNLPARPPPPSSHMSDPMNRDGGPQTAFQQGQAIGPVSLQSLSSTHTASAPSPFFNLPGASSYSASGAAAAASSSSSSSSSSAAPSSSTISAAPQLRDLKKEATAFVPSNMRRKMAKEKGRLEKAGLSKVDAAPSASVGETGSGSGSGSGFEGRKGLLEEMRERGIGVQGAGAAVGGSGLGLGQGQGQGEKGPGKSKGGDEDYRRFEEEMKEFL
ncbi:hypothetical protein JCM11641_005669 [Rhodosporidiobolus odoratus]